jgi:hypothetical protein
LELSDSLGDALQLVGGRRLERRQVSHVLWGRFDKLVTAGSFFLGWSERPFPAFFCYIISPQH